MDSKVLTKLQAIKNRYFRSVIVRKDGLLTHHGDCDIYRAKDMHKFSPCTCGLLHDLRWLDWRLAEKLYPKFGDELASSDMTWEDEKNTKPISEEEMFKFIKDAGWEINDSPPTEEELVEIKKEDEDQWEHIKCVFGEDYVSFLQEQQKEIKIHT